MTDLTGHILLGRYHLQERLGEGGMAVVYKGYDSVLKCNVAVKILRTEDFPPARIEQVLERFRQEALQTAALAHPNIVMVTDFGEYQQSPFLVMKYLPGGTLKDRLDQSARPMPVAESAKLLAPVARALELAHRKGVVHRDIKPANILITAANEPMLTDFGIAKIIGSDKQMTMDGFAIGTPEYMAPEQWSGRNVDGRADIYALGIVFYEMVTGRLPFTADTVPAVMVKAMQDPLPSPRSFSPDIPESAVAVICKALEKDRESRYQTMKDFAVDLEKLAKGEKVKVDVKKTESANTKISSTSKKSVLGWILGATGVLAIIGLVLYQGMGGFAPAPTAQPSSTSIAIIQPTRHLTETISPTQAVSPTAVNATATPVPSPTALAAINGLSLDALKTISHTTSFSTGGTTVSALTYSPDGKLLAATSGKGSIRIFDVAQGRELWNLAVETGKVGEIFFSKDNQNLGAIIDDQAINIWKLSDRSITHTIKFPSRLIDAEYLSKGNQILAVGRDLAQYMVDTASEKITQTIASEVKGVVPGLMALSPAEDMLGFVYHSNGVSSGAMAFWKIWEGKPALSFALQTSNLNMAFSTDGKMAAASGVENGTNYIYIYDVTRGGLAKRILVKEGVQKDQVQYLLFSQDKNLLMASMNNELSFIDLPRGSVMTPAGDPLAGNYTKLALSPDKPCVAAGLNDGTVNLFCISK